MLLEKGKIEGKLEMARKMKDQGIEVEIISKISGLTEKEILAL